MKRLLAYAEYFEKNGGAYFIVHVSLQGKFANHQNNIYYYVEQSSFQRLLNDCGYLGEISRKHPEVKVYFSYGIPIYKRHFKVNWFHLSNLLPFKDSKIKLSLKDEVKMHLLKKRVTAGFKRCDVISAESQHSLDVIGQSYLGKKVLLQNGVNDELVETNGSIRSNTAVTIGAYSYKNLDLLVKVFDEIKEKHGLEKLLIVGEVNTIGKCSFLRRVDIELLGAVPQKRVYELLSESRVYLSMSMIENSSNASLEGVLLCKMAYLSFIPPHLELLKSVPYREEEICGHKVLVSHQEDVRKNLQQVSWRDVILEMLEVAKVHL
ncbi:glycosyltransferase [Halobacteriovorax marinus]|uniref:glycosyltransferase n=1 Tax=Halobacteriovorax marinus TaxID=97084 RepID=UPI0012FDBADC|nr:glycosyltransferase [Halobacteriovorax marinus]